VVLPQRTQRFLYSDCVHKREERKALSEKTLRTSIFVKLIYKLRFFNLAE